jgi:hypothetical protein
MQEHLLLLSCVNIYIVLFADHNAAHLASCLAIQYDRRSGRRLLGVLPNELEQLLPASVARVTMPVVLPNGTLLRIEDFPSVDWSALFMASVLGSQMLAADIR